MALPRVQTSLKGLNATKALAHVLHLTGFSIMPCTGQRNIDMEELLKSLRLMYAKQEEEKDERKREHDATGCFVERIGGCSCWDYAISGETSVGIAQKANPSSNSLLMHYSFVTTHDDMFLNLFSCPRLSGAVRGCPEFSREIPVAARLRENE